MTDTPETEQALVTVTQEDIDALFQSGHPLSRDSKEAIEAGEWNHHHLLQALARHREQAQRPSEAFGPCVVCGISNPYHHIHLGPFNDNHHDYQQAQRTEPSAGEVERVEVKKIETVTGDFLTEPGTPFWRIELDGYCADFDYEEAANNFAAAIQAMRGGQGERAGIVAWLRTDPAIPWEIGPAVTYDAYKRDIADAIERGDFLPGEGRRR